MSENISTTLSEHLTAPQKEEVSKLASQSIGIELSDQDLLCIQYLCQQVIKLIQFRNEISAKVDELCQQETKLKNEFEKHKNHLAELSQREKQLQEYADELIKTQAQFEEDKKVAAREMAKETNQETPDKKEKASKEKEEEEEEAPKKKAKKRKDKKEKASSKKRKIQKKSEKDYKKDKVTYRYQLIKCKCGQILGLKIESTNVKEFKELEKCYILLKDKIAYSLIYG